ncbi:MAG TPA: histidine kinase [Cyclobacteriaceae bacterium]|nr:histidine kinase [Cyclobacteriaceae bacterium]
MKPQHWFIRYKLYHLPFWFVYHYLLWVVMIGSPVNAMNNIFASYYSVKYCFYVLLEAVAVYFNLYFLIPRVLEKGKYVQYVCYFMLTTLCCALLIIPGYYFSAWLSPQTFEEMYQHDPSNWMFFFQVNTFPSSMAAMTLGMSLKLAKNWVQSRQREQALEKEKLETELKFLKSQFNPHFLFNSINSIFVLINKDPRMASEALAKFSDILRYQLYECNEQQIPLGQELDYVSNYIELQKLRHDKDQSDLKIKMDTGNTSGYWIAPFILMPFIENAFKHVSRRPDGSNWIRMELNMSADRLLFNVSNSVGPATHSSIGIIQHGGLGLKNVRRRLELLYPQKHLLDIIEDKNTFRVHLTLSLPGHASPIQQTLTA